jgi:peptidoglycan/xylan/chitin deacetylase (PgdA/CDA1 family)
MIFDEYRKMKLQNIVIASLGFGLLAATGPTANAQTAEPDDAPPMCWAPGALDFRDGEQLVRRGIAQAFVPPPRREAAEFSPRTEHGVVRRVNLPPDKKLIALTFDLCELHFEVAGYQGGIVDFLRKNQIKATFFAGGKWMLTHQERARQMMVDPLFEMANHTWEHRNLRLLAGHALIDEIQGAELAYEQLRDDLKQCTWPDRSTPAYERASKRLALFRFPFGACDAKSLDATAKMGELAIQWDVSSGDPAFGLTPEHMARDVLARVQPGSIVLFHANGRGWHTQGALPMIVAGLKARGYQFTTVSELLAAGEPVFASTCYDSRPGDTDRYDSFFRHPIAENAITANQPGARKSGDHAVVHNPAYH